MIAQAAVQSSSLRTQASTSTPPRDTNLNRKSSIGEPLDEDDSLAIDPFFQGELPEPRDSEEQHSDHSPSIDIPDEPLLDPKDVSSRDEDRLGPDLAEGFTFEDVESARQDDYEQGPTGELGWVGLETSTDTDDDDSADGPLESLTAQLEPLQPIRADGDLEEVPISAGTLDMLVDDADIPWSKERWAELALPRAYSARQSLAFVGTTLCVAGEETHLIDTRNFEPLEDAPLRARTQRILCLDNDAARLLILTTTGQLMLWRRSGNEDRGLSRVQIPNGEVVSTIWQCAPGVPRLLFRLEGGRLLAWNDTKEILVPVALANEGSRLRAQSELGEPRVTLWQGQSDVHLCVDVGTSGQDLKLAPGMSQAVLAPRPLLCGFVDTVLFGIRDHGLFLHGPSQPGFSRVPGCRSITALSAGHMHERPIAFVGLFSELDDRAEIAVVDLATGRANRVAELTIHSDNDGPADDPPERARIDAMLWDPTQLRLWAAGCFGLACFHPPASRSPSALRKHSDQ